MVRVQTPFWGGVGVPNFETHPNCFFPKKAIDAWILICLLWVWPPETGTTRIVSTFLDSRIPIKYTFPLANWQGGPCSMYPSVLQPGLMHLRSKHGFAKPPATVEGEYQAAAKQVSDWKPRETRGICMTNYIFICFVGQVNIKETSSLRIHITWPWAETCTKLETNDWTQYNLFLFSGITSLLHVASCRIYITWTVDGSEFSMTLAKQHTSKWQLPSTVGKTSWYNN